MLERGRAFSILSLITACLIGAVTPLLSPSPALAAPPLNDKTTLSMVYPLMGPRASSDYGTRKHPINRKRRHHHDGIDLAAPKGAIIRSIAAGRVVYADPHGGYGNLVVIKHRAGVTSHYGHCESLKVHPGQLVEAGQIIATVGSTGASTGPHLHFEIRKEGVPQNPERYLPGLDLPAQG
ncbi:MAG: M23 family metallopeptidase [Pseudomonadota bacterium]